MCLIFVGQGYPRKLFNLEHFPIYGKSKCCISLKTLYIATSTFCSTSLNSALSHSYAVRFEHLILGEDRHLFNAKSESNNKSS